MSEPDLAAAILIGGQSRRMGQDKALLTLEPGGPPLVQIVAERLRAVTSRIVLVGANPGCGFLGLPRIDDVFPETGALGGIHAALVSSNGARVLVVACDMPFVSVDLLRQMATLSGDADVVVPVTDRAHPLHAIYAPSCLPPIERNLRAGNYRATGWFDQVQVREIDRETMARFDPALLSCFNMNTPEDLAFARQVQASRSRFSVHQPFPPCGHTNSG